MAGRGIAQMPLHYGHPPERLYRRMQELGGLICDLVTEKYGSGELLQRLSDPFWFHSLSLATGFDWNSSGTTTTTLSALKEYFSKSRDAEFFIAGGKGTTMSSVSSDFEKRVKGGFIGEAESSQIRRRARALAKVDNNLLQDGYDLYMHFIMVSGKGEWIVVQQGMNSADRMARRYHWHHSSFQSRLDDGRDGISSEMIHEKVLDLSSSDSKGNRKEMLDVVRDDPWRYRNLFSSGSQTTLDNKFSDGKQLRLDIRVDWNRLRSIYETQPADFEELMNIKGSGKSTIRAVSMIARLVYGTEPSWRDPVEFSFALGGKDGIPKPVNYPDYDKTIEFYRELLGNLRHGDGRLSAIAENINRRYGRITGNFL